MIKSLWEYKIKFHNIQELWSSFDVGPSWHISVTLDIIESKYWVSLGYKIAVSVLIKLLE